MEVVLERFLSVDVLLNFVAEGAENGRIVGKVVLAYLLDRCHYTHIR